MKSWTKKFLKGIRFLHRDLGYLFIGLTFIYGISGILLVLKKNGEDPSYRDVVVVKEGKTDLSPDELKTYWPKNYIDLPKLTRVIPKDDVFKLYVKGGFGEYQPYDGKITIKTFKRIEIFKFVNDIHYNSGKRYTVMAIIYAIVLIFFAISGAIMVKGKNSFLRRGIWITLIGFLIPLLIFFLG